MRFNPPPGWPAPPPGWQPPPGWTPDPSWPPEPPGWQLWVDDSRPAPSGGPVPFGASPRRWSRGRKAMVAVAGVLVLVGAAGGVFGLLRYQNEQKLVESLTTVDIDGTAYSGVDALATGPDGTLYALTGVADHVDVAEAAVSTVDPVTGATQALPIPSSAFETYRGALAIGADGTVFTGSHLWNPDRGVVQAIPTEQINAATFDDRGRLLYIGSVEDENNDYRATTTVYRATGRGEPEVLATMRGYGRGIAVTPDSDVLLHVDATGWDESAQVLVLSDDGETSPLPVEDIDASSPIFIDGEQRLMHVCSDRHAVCTSSLDGDRGAARLTFTDVQPMWSVDELVRISGFDDMTWLPAGRAIVRTHVRGELVNAVTQQ